MSIQTNQSLSVDCAVFGFNGTTLKVLLIERRYYKPDTHLDPLKLPGAMILENETLPEAAYRVLEEATGLKNVYLKQMEIFSDPNRVSGEELEWINRYHGIHSERVVTVGYYALVKLDSRMVAYKAKEENGGSMPVIVFRTPEGENVVIAGNFADTAAPLSVELGGRYLQAELPPHSFHTFVGE